MNLFTTLINVHKNSLLLFGGATEAEILHPIDVDTPLKACVRARWRSSNKKRDYCLKMILLRVFQTKKTRCEHGFVGWLYNL